MKRSTTYALSIIALTAIAAGPAIAQPMWGDAPPPTFFTLDRGDSGSHVGGQLGWTFFDQDDFDATGLRIDLYGQYVTPTGFGGYGILPISTLFIDNADDETAIGNIEGGVLYVLAQGDVDFVFRGGLTLPTADDEVLGFVANLLASFPRLTDWAHASPETLWVRLGVSPVFRSGQLVLRLDGGIDVALAADDEEPDPILRLNVGGGIDTGTFAILGELVNVGNLEYGVEDPSGDLDEWLHTLTVGARFRSGAVEPGIAVGFPLDDVVNDAINFFLIAGIQGAI
jgi:hypothetical protein